MSDSELAVIAPQTFPAPILIERAGASTRKKFFEFFTVPIRNAHTRAAYYRAIQQFLWEIERAPSGMNRSMIEHAVMPRHSPAVLLNQVIELLVRAGMIAPFVKYFESGRKVTFWRKSQISGTPLPRKY
jgi:hypothetical protein